MTRLLTLLTALLMLAALLSLAGCSDDDPNQPPRVSIIFPGDGYTYDGTTSLAEVEVTDDGAVAGVELRLDDLVVSSLDDERQTQLPVGRWADGLEHELRAHAVDAEGLTGDSSPVTVRFATSLQTIPQIVDATPAAGAPGELSVTWLAFPGAMSYRWQAARTDAFADLLGEGEVDGLTVSVPVGDVNLVYLRVQAVFDVGASEFSRTFRHDGTTGWRQRYAVPDRQLGTAVFTAPDGSLRLLSQGLVNARVGEAAVQLLHVTATGELVTSHTLLARDYRPTSHLLTADGHLLLAGLHLGGPGSWLASFTLDGEQRWLTELDGTEATALMAADGGEYWLFGTDTRDDAMGGVVQQIDLASGALTELGVFQLEAGRRILVAWSRPGGGWVIAGSLPTFADLSDGGLFARGLDGALATDWNLRLGEADRWELRGHGTDGNGQYVLGGIAFTEVERSRYGFLVSLDHRGRLRWQLGETAWHLHGQIIAGEDGRWTVVGAKRRYTDSNHWLYDTALRGLSEAGLPLWEIQHRSGEESQGFGLAAHPEGGWYAVGFMTPDRAEYDVDLLRVDDRGELE